MKNIIAVLATIVALALSAGPAYANAPDPDTGVELQAGSLKLAAFRWRLVASDRSRASDTLKDYGVLNVPPGDYQLEFGQGISNWLPMQAVTVRAGKINKIEFDTGVSLNLGPAAKAVVASGSWQVIDGNNYIIAEIEGLGGTAALPPGKYSILAGAEGQQRIKFADIELTAGQLSQVAIDTAFTLKNHPELKQPKFWQLADPSNKRNFTVVENRWGSALLPPGKYAVLIKLANNSTIDYGEVTLAAGQANELGLDSGLALNVDQPNSSTDVFLFRAGETEPFFSSDLESLTLPLAPGDYQLSSQSSKHYSWGPGFTVAAGQITALKADFESDAVTEQAEVLAPDFKLAGFNIASAALGGKVESFSSAKSGDKWQGHNLIDGFDIINARNNSDGCDKSCGWQSERSDLAPHELVFSFNQQRLASLDSIIIDNGLRSNLLPRRLRVLVSSESAEAGFVEVVEAKLEDSLRPQRIVLPPGTQAKFVKLQVTSTYGYPAVGMGEVQIIESSSGQSILHDVEFDLARPELGGSLVRFSSQKKGNEALGVSWKEGYFSDFNWVSSDSRIGPANYLPQELVFAFNGKRIANLERLVIEPTGLGASLAKEVVIERSLDSPMRGFEEIARVQLAAEASPQSFELKQKARFLRLRITQTHGAAASVKLGKVSIIEASGPAQQSVLAGGGEPEPAAARPAVAAATGAANVSEREPNNSQAEAGALVYGQTVSGVINPLGEQDYYRLAVDKPAVVSTVLGSEPSIQTQLSVLAADGSSLYEFSPGNLVSNQKRFSLNMKPGDYFYRITQAPHRIVLIWDVSGSMSGSEKDLGKAVNSFIDNVGDNAQLQLIKFSSDVNVLTEQFSNDVEALKQAAKGNFGANGGTRLYDAIDAGLELLAKEQGNKAIVVMTDGQDSGSRMAYHDLWHRLKDENVSIYTVGLGDILNQYSPRIGATGMQLLSNISLATRAKSLYAEKSGELDGLYQDIVAALTDQRPYQLQANIDNSPGLLRLTTNDKLLANTTSSNFEIILDASGSMRSNKNRIDGELKIDVAKKVLGDIVRKLPESSDLAFRVFGHRVREYDSGDCRDTELLYPLGQIKRQQLINSVNKIKVSNGTTPLTYSMVQAAKDLVAVEGEKHIVVVTDGEEYCGAKPEETVKKLIELGFNIRLDIVGIDLKQQQVRDSMQRVAQISGGQFYNVQTNKGFAAAIESVLGASYRVSDSAGNEVAHGRVNGEPVKLPQGFYTVEVGSASEPLAMGEVTVSADQLTTIDIVKNGALVEKAALNRSAASAEDWAGAEKAVAEAVAKTEAKSPEQLRQVLEQLEAEVLKAKANRPKP